MTTDTKINSLKYFFQDFVCISCFSRLQVTFLEIL